jgi:DNA polymerase elongation subunit (family B)
MTEYYLDTEIGYDDPEIVEKLRNDEHFSFNPKNCKIITIQFQQIDRYGRGVGNLRILKEWESSEEEIIKKFAQILCPENKWNFIPVGYNIYFDLGLFKERAKVYGINYDKWFIYHDLPAIDIKPICLALNNFQFKGSGLDKFTGKEHSGAIVPIWYSQREHEKILDYIEKETEEFLLFYQKLKLKIPEFRKLLNLQPIESIKGFNNFQR